MVAEDVENDAKEFDGKPFTGKIVAEYFGNHGAAIKALADVLKELIENYTLKLIILIPIILLFSCTKDASGLVVKKYDLTAVLTVKPTQETVCYEVFVSNNKNAPINLWLFAGRVYRADLKTTPYIFGFDVPTVCYLTIDVKDSVYGFTREVITGGERLKIDYDNIIIHKN